MPSSIERTIKCKEKETGSKLLPMKQTKDKNKLEMSKQSANINRTPVQAVAMECS